MSTKIIAIGDNRCGQFGIGTNNSKQPLTQLPHTNISNCGRDFTIYHDSIIGKIYLAGNNKYGHCLQKERGFVTELKERPCCWWIHFEWFFFT